MRKHKLHPVTRPVLIAVLAITLALGAGIGTAWAYFTTYAMAKGTVPLKLGHQEHLTEQFDNWDSLQVYPDFVGLFKGDYTVAQFQETYKQEIQDAMDRLAGN